MSSIEGRLFLVGCPRSGTTLLQSLLAAHPLITSFPESHFFSKVQANWRWLRALGAASRDARSHLHSYFEGMDYEKELRQVLPWGMISVRAHASAFVRGLDAVARRREVLFWLEKTPQHLHYVEDIQQYVPEATFIHIVRRGEDVVASMFEVTHRHPEEWNGARDVQTCLRRWTHDIDLTLRYSRLSNHVVVHYNDVVNRTESALRRVCRNVGIEYDSQMIERYKETAQRVRTDRETWKEGNTDEISPREDKFNRVFNEEEKEIIEKRSENRNEALDRFTIK